MRVVGGKYKGRKLSDFYGKAVRPTSDMTRESFFNIVSGRIEGASFLDLFCGTGAMGIEAISRGAERVVFNDASRESLTLLKKNLAVLDGAENYKIFNLSAEDLLKRSEEKFDYVYIDPPYDSDLGEKALSLVGRVLKENGVAVFESERPFGEKIKDLFLFDERRYGRAVLSFFKLKTPCAVFAGTFDPVTVGHESVILRALEKYGRVLVVLGENPQKTPFFSKNDRLNLLKETFIKKRGAEVYDYSAISDYAGFLKDENATVYIRGIRDEKDFKYEKDYEIRNAELYPFVKTEYVYAEEFKSVCSEKVRESIKKGEDVSSMIPEKARKYFKKIIKKAKP